MKKENIPAYEIVKQEKLTDIHSTGYLVRHKKTGARLVLIENDDENKVFLHCLSYYTEEQHWCSPHIWNTAFCADPANFR